MIPVSTRSGEAQKQWLECVRKRLAITSSMLSDMKAVRMLGIANTLSTIISRLRKIEIGTSMRFRKLLSSPGSKAILHKPDLKFYRGITMIIGPVGSGKSTLIETVLGNTILRFNSTTVPLSTVAYCPQSPWIVNDTIRNNITGSQPL